MKVNQYFLRRVIGRFLMTLGMISIIFSSFWGGAAALAEEFPTASDPTPPHNSSARIERTYAATGDPLEESLMQLPSSIDRDKARAAFLAVKRYEAGEDPDDPDDPDESPDLACVVLGATWIGCTNTHNNSASCMAACESYKSDMCSH